jgi:NAD(P)-dependent dehydrogenase (short-subunit alcohol dehydrogenase family)
MAKRLLTSVSAQLDGIGKALIALAGLAYSVGFLLVNFDLARYRVTGFSLARPQYVLVGAVWSILTAIALVPPFFTAYVTKYGQFKSKLGRIRFVIIWLSASLWLFLLPATKRALKGWSENMAFELDQFGIGMKVIEPGGMKTDFFIRSFDTGRHPAYDTLVDKVMSVIATLSRWRHTRLPSRSPRWCTKPYR